MNYSTVAGILLPLIGTSVGSACVFLMSKASESLCGKKMTAFAAGIMTAASVWSLLIPATECSENMGRFAFIPAVAGFWCGVLILVALDFAVGRSNINGIVRQRPGKIAMLVLAVAIHNIPEGMAVGAVFAGLLSGLDDITVAGALSLSLGIAIQNLPEGAIISLPLRAAGYKKTTAFGYGVASGIAEPFAALITVAASDFIIPILPFMLSLAAGAMIYVVIDELINETTTKECIVFSLGFTLMMSLDVALG